MAFSMNKNDEPKEKKRPPLPPRDDISEDSMEDMVSDFDAENAAPVGKSAMQRGPAVKPSNAHNLSIDTDTILKNANQLNESMASDGLNGEKGKNILPLPQPLADSIQITEAYLKQFK